PRPAPEGPRHLAAQTAVPEARTACMPTLTAPGHICAIDRFGVIGEVAGHAFFYAKYDITPAPGDSLYPLPIRHRQFQSREAPCLDERRLARCGRRELARGSGEAVTGSAAYPEGSLPRLRDHAGRDAAVARRRWRHLRQRRAPASRCDGSA